MAAFKLTMSVLVGNLMAAFKLTMSVLDGSVGQHLMAAFELTMSIGFRLTPFRG